MLFYRYAIVLSISSYEYVNIWAKTVLITVYLYSMLREKIERDYESSEKSVIFFLKFVKDAN